MFQQLESHHFLFRLIVGSLIIVTAILLLPFLVTSTSKNTVQAQESTLTYNNTSTIVNDSPNIITSGLTNTATEIELTTYQVKDGAKKSAVALQSIGVRITHWLTYTSINIATTSNQIIVTGLRFSITTVSNSIIFILKIPSSTINGFTRVSVVNRIMRPSDQQENSVPLIDPNSPDLKTALSALPPIPVQSSANNMSENLKTTKDDEAKWPLHGKVTTLFGVVHWPYQPTHTGIDISDGQKSGVTPVYSYRNGKVVEIINSKQGLGKHVIVDHGSGVMSVYGHLASISVQKGQDVTKYSILGKEGSTGVSTGTHLHFEIRVNGRATNPRQFIRGNP